MTAPEKVRHFAADLHADRERLAELAKEHADELAMAAEADQEAAVLRARLAEAEQLSASSRARATALDGERAELEAGIADAEIMLGAVMRSRGYDVTSLAPAPAPSAPVLAPEPLVPGPLSPIAQGAMAAVTGTPHQGTPVVRVAEPGRVAGDGRVDCAHCTHGIYQPSDGTWLHLATNGAECPLPAETVPDGDPTQRQELPGAVVAAALKGGGAEQ